MIVAIVPARLESSRLRRKLLLAETGKPLILHTVDRVKQASRIDRVIVATDSQAIADAVHGHCDWMFTSEKHQSGTDRISEAVKLCGITDDTVIVNVQGDECEVEPDLIDAVADLASNPFCDLATACTSLGPLDIDDQSAVKVLLNGNLAVEFTRHWEPHSRRHIGIYGFRPDYLRWFASTPRTQREILEGLEQLRALNHDKRIVCCKTLNAANGIDTRADYENFKERQCLKMT